MNEWIGVKEVDTWHVVHYVYQGEELHTDMRHGNELLFTEGMDLEVQFPDGVIETRVLGTQRMDVFYSTRTNVAPQVRYGFYVTVHGAGAWLPIHHVKIRKGSVPQRKDHPLE